MVGRDPQNKIIADKTAELELLGGGHGAMMSSPYPIPIATTGLYFIEVYLESRLLTRMPLEIRYAKVEPTADAAQNTTATNQSAKKKSPVRKVRKPKS
jgi:hypothetical protein